MTDQLPAPLVPPEVDLRGYEFMPLYGDRLFKSTTWISGTPEAKIAALRLWWQSYAHEIPAGSLPDDDVMLADYAGYGVMVKAWCKVKPQAMRGWIKCSDGRLYHKIVCEFANSAWQERLKARAKGKAGASKRWGNSDGTGNATTTKTDSTSNSTGNASAIARDRIGEGKDIKTTTSKPLVRGSRLEPDWQIPQGWIGWAMGEQPTWTIDYAMRISHQFKDYWIAAPGQRGVKADWEATWRNWVRKEKPMPGAKLGFNPEGRPPSGTAQAVEILEGMKS